MISAASGPLMLLLLLLSACADPQSALSSDADRPSPVVTTEFVDIEIRGHRLRAEIAAEPAARTRGLMARHQLPADEGMLFIFPNADRHSFWMRHTPLPLSAAFLEDDGTIQVIVDLDPFDEIGQRPPRPVRYVLETRQGWFRERNIVPGDRCRFQRPRDLVAR